MKKELKTLFLLHIMLMIYSFSGVFSKMAAKTGFLSFKFCLFYGCLIMLLGFYAIGWQQIIKRLPLTTAFANKAVTVVWGIIWGFVFFRETITIGKIIGAALVITGVVLYSYADGDDAVNSANISDIAAEHAADATEKANDPKCENEEVRTDE